MTSSLTGASCAAALIDRGLDPREFAAKSQLFDRVMAACPGSHVVCWVPGRLEIFGRHTDYAGGRTLTAALPKGFAFAASGRSDGVVDVLDARSGERVTIGRSGGEETAGWRHYVEVVVQRLRQNFRDASLGADIALVSDLPPASGMSSSSALVVGLAQSLIQVSGIARTVLWRNTVATPLDAAAYFASIENGSRFGTLDGSPGVGTHGGSEDHATMLGAAGGHVTAFAFVPPRRLEATRMPADWRFVVAQSGVKAEKTGTARAAYNRLSAGARLLLQVWNRSEPPVSALAIALESGPGAAARLRDHLQDSRGERADAEGWTRDALVRRLDHFVREDGRVRAALGGFTRANRADLDALSADSQADADALLGNQVPQTIALTRSAREQGAFAACSFGAGFGGSVWALVDAPQADAFAARWHPSAFIAQPGPPLVRFQSSELNKTLDPHV